MSTKINSVLLCMMAHPDNQPDSEFADRIDDLIEIQNQLKNHGVIDMFDEDTLKIVYTQGFKHAKACAPYQRDKVIEAIKRADDLYKNLKIE